MPIRQFISCIIFLLLLIPSNLWASSQISIVQIKITDSDGTVLSGVDVVAVDENGVELDFSVTNTSGFANFFNLFVDDAITFVARPQFSNQCRECLILKEGKSPQFILAKSGSNYDSNQDLYDAGSLALSKQDYIVEVTVKDQEGNLVNDLDISGWSESDPDKYGFGRTKNGKISFGAAVGLFFVNSFSPDRSYSDAFAEVEVKSQGVTSIALVVNANNASVTIHLINSDGTEYRVPSGERPGVSCNEDLGESEHFQEEHRFAFTDVAPGKSSAKVSLALPKDVELPFRCTVHMQNRAASFVHFNIKAGDTDKAFVSTIIPTNHSVHVKFLDDDGNLVPMEVGVFAFVDPHPDEFGTVTPFDHYFEQFEADNGIYKLTLAKNVNYQLNFHEDYGNSDVNGQVFANNDQRYVADEQFKVVKTSGDSPQEVVFNVKKADLTVEVEVQDIDGSKLSNAWVDLVCGDHKPGDHIGSPVDNTAPENHGEQFFTGGNTDSNGKLTLYGRSGLECQIFTWIPWELLQADGTLRMNPAPVEFKGEAGTKSVVVKVAEADVVTSVTLSLPESANVDSIEWGFCDFHSTDNTVPGNFADFFDSKTQTVALVSDSKYLVHCEVGNGSDLYVADVTYESPTKGVTEDTLTVELDSGGLIYPPTTVNFNPAAAFEITLSDNKSSVSFPAGFVSADTVTFQFGTNTEPVQRTDQMLMKSPWDFTLLVSGKPYKDEFLKPVTVVAWYDQSGIDESKLTGCITSNSSGTGHQLADCTVNTDENTFTILMSHFSDVGLNFAEALGSNDDEQAPTDTAPTNVKAKKQKAKKRKSASKTKAKVSWDKVTNATSYEIKISIVKNGKLTTKTKSVKAKTKGDTQSKVIKLKSSGSYSFSVAAVVDGVTSAYTTAEKTIKVKKNKAKK